MSDHYLGYREGDADTPFGHFFKPDMAPLSAHVLEALAIGPQSPELLGEPDGAAQLLHDGYLPVETGYAAASDGSFRVAVLTPMPRVTAQMWDWWFGWHGCDARRYKLWHPRAHRSAQWQDGADNGRRGRERYVGRTSLVDEYVGSLLAKVTIRFLPPKEVGLESPELAPGGERTIICARIGSSQFPVDAGWLVHDVRPTSDGCEMRSRFWLGGGYIALRAGVPAGISKAVTRAASAVLPRPGMEGARALLVHCAQEMSHLAAFLPELYAECSPAEVDLDL